MFELWARKRATDGVGHKYEWIFNFNDEDYKYTAIDSLDRSIYQECMVMRDKECILYVPLNKPMVKKIGSRENITTNVRSVNKTLL